MEQKAKAQQGFAALSPERRKEIATMGGKAAQASGKGHRWTSEEAQAAGRIGGKSVSKNRKHMREIGQLGGKARAVEGV